MPILHKKLLVPKTQKGVAFYDHFRPQAKNANLPIKEFFIFTATFILILSFMTLQMFLEILVLEMYVACF